MTYYCGECSQECTVHTENDGIGSYEAWGAKFRDTHIVLRSDCCDGTVFENEELTEEADAGAYEQDQEDARGDYEYECRRDREMEERDERGT